MGSSLGDLRLALRRLRAAPLTALAAVGVIALGTGANSAALGLAWGVLLRPLPYPEPERLAILSVASPDGEEFGLPREEVDEWRRRLGTVEALGGFGTAEITLRNLGEGHRGEPRVVRAAVVTAGFFETLGVAPARGTLAAAGFEEPHGAGGVVASAALERRWRAAGGGSLVGRSLRVGKSPVTVAAVLPESFAFPSEAVELWLPLEGEGGAGAGYGLRPGPPSLHLIARLRAGTGPDDLRREAARVLAELRGGVGASGVGEEGRSRPLVRPLEEALTGELRPVLGAFVAGAVLVLLAACGNVAMLLLARALRRRKETAVRSALGADRGELLRPALAESFLLAVAGSVLGLVLAAGVLRSFLALAAGRIPRADAVPGALAPDPFVLVVAVATVLVVTVLCCAGPAVHALRQDPARALAGSASVRGDPAQRGGSRLLAALVVLQIAAALVLLSGAGLLGATVARLLDQDTGVEPAGVLVAELSFEDPDGARDLVAAVLEEVRALPGVEAAGLGDALPPARVPFRIYVQRVTEAGREGRPIYVVRATRGYLEALGTRRIAGRTFSAEDERFDAPVLVASESAARFLEPALGLEAGEGAVRRLPGRELTLPLPPLARLPGQPRFAGVIGDVQYEGLDRPRGAALYLPWNDRPSAQGYLAVRTAVGAGGGDPLALAPAVRRILRRAAPELPVPELRTLEAEMARSIGDRSLRILPAAFFAVVALGVALAGVFALFARNAAERRREIAVLLALGASRGRVTARLLRRAALLVGAGVVVGLAGSWALGRGLARLLWGVGPHEPAVLAGAALAVAATALLAAWLPTRRATRVEPGESLRAG